MNSAQINSFDAQRAVEAACVCLQHLDPDAGLPPPIGATDAAHDLLDAAPPDDPRRALAEIVLDAAELVDPEYGVAVDHAARTADATERRAWWSDVHKRLCDWLYENPLVPRPPELAQWVDAAPVEDALALLARCDMRNDRAAHAGAAKRLQSVGVEVIEIPSVWTTPGGSGKTEIVFTANGAKTTDLIDVRSAFQRQESGRRALERLAMPATAAAIAELGGRIEAATPRADKTPLNIGNGEVSSAQVYQPFPVDALPEPICGFVTAGSKALGVDPAYLGTAILPVLAGAIGNAAIVRLKRDWGEPCVVWAALIGESGTLKSPALDLAMHFTRRRQAQAIATYAEAEKSYEQEKTLYEADRKLWQAKGRAKGEPPPEAPAEPVCARHYCSDTTVEALAVLLQRNPRGVLVARDELSGWLLSFDQYKGGRGGDSAHWLAMHGARDLLVDRKSNGQKPIYCPRAAVSVVGGVQPQTLRHALGREHFENGMAARMLVAMPPATTKRWTDATVDPATLAAVERVFNGLYDLSLNTDPNGRPQPWEIVLSADGKAQWVRWYNSHARRQADAQGDNAAMLSKMEAYAARLALIIHLVRLAAVDPTLRNTDSIDANSIWSGCLMADWYAAEAERVYAALAQGKDSHAERELIEWIQRRGGGVTARDLQRNIRRYSDGDSAERALAGLVQAGLGTWTEHPPSPDGGRPTQVFSLTARRRADETPATPQDNEVSSARQWVDDANAALAEAAVDHRP
jgi:hypothetical protein